MVVDPPSPQANTEAALRLAHELFCCAASSSPSSFGASLDDARSPAAAEQALLALAAAAASSSSSRAPRGGNAHDNDDDLAARLARALVSAPPGERNLASLLRRVVGVGVGAGRDHQPPPLSADEARALRALLLG